MSDSIIFRTQDTYGRTVTLVEGRWRHITTEHPEVKLGAIRKTVEDHHFTVTSDTYPGQDLYYRLSADVQHPSLYCAVATDFSRDKVGMIITAYYTKKPMKGGTVKHVNVHK